MFKLAVLAKGSAAAVMLLLSSVLQAEHLDSEQMGKIEKLPSEYPASWMFAHDPNFNALTEGKVIVVDVNSVNNHYKGTISSAQFGSFIASTKRNELYSGETFYSRGTRGTRVDVVSISNKNNLAIIDEIVLPGNKRAQTVTEKNTLQLVDDDDFLLVFNFTPAASVTIIDIEKRKILNTIDIPGCSLIYPTGPRGFSSLCTDGGLLSFQFDRLGEITAQFVIPPFFDAAIDPLFEKSIYLNGIAYFPTFLGQVQAIDFSHAKPKILPPWSLVTAREREQKWRPGGWQISTSHPKGEIYILMHKNGFNGSHKDGGSEVWVFDVKNKRKIKTITLKNHGISIE
ncbi:MAG: hypothetical protein JKY85_08790, partial [Porticoccus sp.]|nr:hypothetical protein [Porticoccus sp.]